MKKFLVISTIILAAVAAGIYYYQSQPEPIPAAQPRNNQPSPLPSPSANPSQELPQEVNLAVPFTSQAPHANWNEPYQNFCEEASVLMAASYIQGVAALSPDDADQKMLAIMRYEVDQLGYHKDTTAAETAKILSEYYKINEVQLVHNPTEAQIKQHLAAGKVIVMPADGKALGNPNFRNGGPDYHMLVIKGYTKSGQFITNDPGTRNGADYLYSPETILDALHDWNNGDVKNGQKLIIVVG